MTNVLKLAATASAQAITLALVSRDQGGALVHYTTFDTNKPKTYGNTLYVWEAAGPVIPWDNLSSFVGQKTISEDSHSNSERIPFNYKVSQGYIVGYAVGPDPAATCAAIYLPPNDEPLDSTSLSLRFSTFAPGAVIVSYTALDQYNPKSNKNWVAIWNGPRANYNGDFLKAADIPYPNTSGKATIQHPLLIGATYTVGYFMTAMPSGKTTLAAQVTFNT